MAPPSYQSSFPTTIFIMMIKKSILALWATSALLVLASCAKKAQPNATQPQAAEQPTDTLGADSQAANSTPYPDLEMPGINGQMVRLSDIVSRNKLTLVDFWASWCGPCRAEMPHVVQAYKDFHAKGLEIVGVSLDQRKADWTAAVEELHMAWPQMSDLKGWNSKAVALYGIQGIPFSVLINQQGEIVGQDLRGDGLHQRLGELLK